MLLKPDALVRIAAEKMVSKCSQCVGSPSNFGRSTRINSSSDISMHSSDSFPKALHDSSDVFVIRERRSFDREVSNLQLEGLEGFLEMGL